MSLHTMDNKELIELNAILMQTYIHTAYMSSFLSFHLWANLGGCLSTVG